jgi:ornithine--oxo-acid transaminase
VPFGDYDALAAAITPNTAAFLVEPVQGEAGIIVPPAGYLARCAALCRKHNVLLICDEVQTGMGRTGSISHSSRKDSFLMASPSARRSAAVSCRCRRSSQRGN